MNGTNHLIPGTVEQIFTLVVLMVKDKVDQSPTQCKHLHTTFSFVVVTYLWHKAATSHHIKIVD